MKGKNSFILYADLKNTLDQLPDDVCGRLFKLILDYVNDLNPSTDELVLKVAFEPIKQQLKRDLKSWGNVKEKRSYAGKVSAIQKQILTSVDDCSTNSTVTDNVNVNVNVIDFTKLIELYNLVFERNCKVVSETIRKKYRARLKEGYSKQDIILAMRNAKKDEYHKSTDYKYCTLEFFSRPDKLDRFINMNTNQKYVPTK
jgi:hypothetical protein